MIASQCAQILSRKRMLSHAYRLWHCYQLHAVYCDLRRMHRCHCRVVSLFLTLAFVSSFVSYSLDKTISKQECDCVREGHLTTSAGKCPGKLIGPRNCVLQRFFRIRACFHLRHKCKLALRKYLQRPRKNRKCMCTCVRKNIPWKMFLLKILNQDKLHLLFNKREMWVLKMKI